MFKYHQIIQYIILQQNVLLEYHEKLHLHAKCISRSFNIELINTYLPTTHE